MGSGCNIETSPYTGNGMDPPTCGGPIVMNRMCVTHLKQRVYELMRVIDRSERALAAERAELMAITLHLMRQS